MKRRDMLKNIYYVEMLPEQIQDITMDQLINEVARKEFNKSIGREDLNNEDAMSEDILAPYLKRLKNKTGKSNPHRFFRINTNNMESSKLKDNKRCPLGY